MQEQHSNTVTVTTAAAPANGFVKTFGPVRYEDIQRRLGPNTRWHILIFIIGNIPGIFGPFHNLGSIFTIYTPDHWCSLPVNSSFINATALLSSNWTVDRVRTMSIPRTETGAFDKCRMYDRPDYDVILSEPWSEERWGSNGTALNDSTLQQTACQRWTYDRSQMTSTIVTELDLVCGAKGWASLAKSAYMIGMFFGSALYGYLSDRFGRRRSLLISLAQYLLSGFLLSSSSNYYIFLFFRASTGMAAIATYLIGYIVTTRSREMLQDFIRWMPNIIVQNQFYNLPSTHIPLSMLRLSFDTHPILMRIKGVIGSNLNSYIVNETVNPEIRGVIQMISNVPFSLGIMVMPGLAYFVRDWKFFNLGGSIISLTMLIFIWVFPESPRWLILQGRLDEAKAVLQRIARTNHNKGTTDEELTKLIQQCYDYQKREQGLQEVNNKRWIIFDLLRTSAMRKNTIICCYLWATVASGYYGLSYSSPSFGNSVFLVTFIAGSSELPIIFAGIFIIKYMRRRLALGGSYLIGGAFCLVFLAAPIRLPWLGSTLALCGRCFISLAFTFIYIVTSEIFPTNRRNIAMGVCSAFARIGAVMAPFITDFLGAYNVGYSMAVFGVELVVAGLLCFLLKETGDKTLPETEVDVKNLDELLLKETPASVVIETVKF